MWISILCVILAILIYFKGIKPLTYWKKREVPSTKPWPFLGDLGATVFGKRALAHSYEDIYKIYPEKRYVGFYNMSTPALMLRDPDLIKKITVKEFDKFPQHRPFIPEDADPLWSKNLFAMKGGENWQNMRATLSPAFTSSKIRMMFELMKECAKQFSDYFLKQDGRTITVEMKDVFTRFTNDVIATTAFGVTCDSLKHQENEFYLMGKEITSFSGIRSVAVALHSFSPTLAKFLKIPMFNATTKDFYKSLIKNTIRVREELEIERSDMIHLLMEARKGRLKDEEHTCVIDSGFAVGDESELEKTEKGQKAEITEEDITAQALVFLFAGFDTVSTVLCHATYELALNPDVQEKLRKEIDKVVERSKSQITYETIMAMKYLSMVVAETLRKWPPFVSTDRQSTISFTIEAGHGEEKPLHLKAGLSCVIPIYAIHRDSKYYPNPEKFDPERFGEENKQKIKPFTYLPFGAGPRNCIGSRFALLEIKVIITEIIRKFEIVPIKETKIPIEISKRNFIPVSEDGFWLGLKPRNNTL